MKNLLSILLSTIILLVSSVSLAQATCPEGKACVDKGEMPTIIEALREKKCLITTQPEISAEPVTVIIDRDGRVYGSGSGKQPFKLGMKWCTYELSMEGQTRIVSAQRVEPEWGFRFRPKAAVGILGTELLRGELFRNTIDGGVLVEPFFFHFVNINAYVGVRSIGGAFGFDIVKNFGAYTSYTVGFDGWRGQPGLGLYFSFL